MSNVRLRLTALMTLAVSLGCTMAGCGSDLEGTYSDADGNLKLELRFGGQATLTFMGQSGDCTYSVAGKQLTLTCQDLAKPIELTIQDDGSLSGAPNTSISTLRKTK